MRIRPLPRSLDPLPAESLPGYLLRLAHRLDLSPLRIAALTGLSTPRGPTSLPASRMFALDPATTDTFAHATRLSTAEVGALTLARFSDRYPFLDLGFCGRQRTIPGMLVKENWVFFRATRYCPDCLAGNSSVIQQRHGGAWNQLWRLPITFACTRHQRLLHHTCPDCGQPVHDRSSSRTETQHMLPMAGATGLHPAQCRATLADPTTGNRSRVCGTRLDTAELVLPAPAAPLIELQRRLLDLLDPDGPTNVVSAGQPTTPQSYLVDLRILCCLITATWPAASGLADDGDARRRLDTHVRATQHRLTSMRNAGHTVRELGFYDAPPLDAATCAYLLATADTLLSTNTVDSLRSVLRPLLVDAPRGTRLWVKQFLANDRYCSPGLQAALGLEFSIPGIRTRLGLPPTETPQPSPPPHDILRFGLQHIPQHLLTDWYTEHLERFANLVKPRLVRRAAAAQVAQLCVGGSPVQAARTLGIPRFATENALSIIRYQLSSRDKRKFDTAVDTLTGQLNTASCLVNYGNRRDSLASWELSTQDWENMISDLRQRPRYRRAGRWCDSPYIDWGDDKHILASTWIWVRVTSGEHLFAPAIRPNLDQNRTTHKVNRTIFSRWPLISADHLRGHWAELRERLDPYADHLMNLIDSNNRTGPCRVK